MKKLFCVLCILFPIVFILSCKQITETTEEITQVNYIVPVWKGSLPTAPSNPEVGWATIQLLKNHLSMMALNGK